MHGYQIIQELVERSGGLWRPSPGSIYPTLSALEDEGLVKADQQQGKRVFELTDEGRAALAESADRPAPWDEVANDADVGLVALRDQMAQVAAATMQVAHAGDKRQLEAAGTILRETRRRLYLLLAEEPEGESETTAGDVEG
jgi:DNA-binding PadR family transcriptional regulator